MCEGQILVGPRFSALVEGQIHHAYHPLRMPQRPQPSRPFASAPNRADPTRLFASVWQSLPTSTNERARRRATNEPGPDEGDSLDAAAAHRAASALDENPGCHVAQNDAAAHRAALALDEPQSVAHCNFQGEVIITCDAPKDCARATVARSLQSASQHELTVTYVEQSPIGSSAHADTAHASCPEPGAIAAFVDFVYQRALLDVESSGKAIERQPKRLQHDHVLAETRWRDGLVARCRGRGAAKLQSVIQETNDATCQLAMKAKTASVREHR